MWPLMVILDYPLTIQSTPQTATNINKHHQRTSVCSGHLHQDKCIQCILYFIWICVCVLLRPRIRSFFLILSSSGIFRGHVQSWKISFFLFLIAGVSSFWEHSKSLSRKITVQISFWGMVLNTPWAHHFQTNSHREAMSRRILYFILRQHWWQQKTCSFPEHPAARNDQPFGRRKSVEVVSAENLSWNMYLHMYMNKWRYVDMITFYNILKHTMT